MSITACRPSSRPKCLHAVTLKLPGRQQGKRQECKCPTLAPCAGQPGSHFPILFKLIAGTAPPPPTHLHASPRLLPATSASRLSCVAARPPCEGCRRLEPVAGSSRRRYSASTALLRCVKLDWGSCSRAARASLSSGDGPPSPSRSAPAPAARNSVAAVGGRAYRGEPEGVRESGLHCCGPCQQQLTEA